MGLVSIIIPVYNSVTALSKCLESVVSQSYKNIEVILVNDGSTDGSEKICDSFAEKDDRVRVFHNANHGVSFTRNFGIEHCAGNYIMFVDSDDHIEPDTVELLMNAMEKYSVDLVFGGYGKFNDGNSYDFEVRGILPNETAPSGALFQNKNEVAMLFTQARTSLAAVAVWAKLYRADIIQRFNIRFPLDVSYEEDCCFNLLYFRHISTAYAFQKPIYHYRQCVQSLSKSFDLMKFHALIDGYNKRCEFFREIGMENHIPALKNILILVLITSYQKIEKCSMSRLEKIRNYNEIAKMTEVQDVVNTATQMPRRRLYKLSVSATRNKSGKRIWLWMHLWSVKNIIKSKLKRKK